MCVFSTFSLPIFYNNIFTFHFNKPANLIYKLNSQYLLKAFCVGCEEEGIIRFAMAAWNPILRRRQRMTRIENRDVYVIRWTPWDRVYRNPGMKIVIYVWFYNCWKGTLAGFKIQLYLRVGFCLSCIFYLTLMCVAHNFSHLCCS